MVGAVGLCHAVVAAQRPVTLAEVREGSLWMGGAQLSPLLLGGLGQRVGAVCRVAVELEQALGTVVEPAGGTVGLGGTALGAELAGCRAWAHGDWQRARRGR